MAELACVLEEFGRNLVPEPLLSTACLGPMPVATRATRKNGGWILEREKTLVLDGGSANKLIVTARVDTSDRDHTGISLFVVDADTPGLAVRRQSTMDLHNRSAVELREVEVPDSAMLEDEGCGEGILQRTLQYATVGLSSELLGNAEGAFALTLEYLKTRKQL